MIQIGDNVMLNELGIELYNASQEVESFKKHLKPNIIGKVLKHFNKKIIIVKPNDCNDFDYLYESHVSLVNCNCSRWT